MQCIEDILEVDILESFKYLYNKSEDTQAVLLFFLRAHIFWGKEDLTNEQYISFLIKELNLPKDIIYKECKISTRRYDNNSLQNIIDNFIFQYLDKHHSDPVRGSISGKELIHNYYKDYSDSVQKHFKGRKTKINYFNYISKYYMLLNLYKDLNLLLQPIKKFNNFEYPIDHNHSEKCFDSICKTFYDEYLKNEEKLKEKDLEDYICKNGFKDIKIINRQLKIQSGKIDLLGIDSENKKVLIELKVTSRPKDLIWQIQAYTVDLKKIYKELRTIVISPPLDSNILNQISKEFEVYEFKRIGNKYKFKQVQ